MIEIKDEILTGEPRYRVRDNNGNIIQDNVTIEQITPVKQEGTEINKSLFTNFNNGIMDETKEAIFDYTLTEDAEQFDINGLDLLADGGLYELIVIGGVNKASGAVGLGMRINGITDSVYAGKSYSASSINSRDYIDIGCATAGMTTTLIGLIDGVRATSIGVDGASTEHFYNAKVANIVNVTSISIVLPSNSTATGVKAGTQIKLYKRR